MPFLSYLPIIGRTDVEAETPILWPPDAKSWLIGKDPDAGKDWGQKEKGTTEDEMVGWHHRLNGHGFGCTPAIGDGQGGLACCSSWGRKESDTTEWLNWTEPIFDIVVHYSFFIGILLPERAWNRLFIPRKQEISLYTFSSNHFFLEKWLVLEIIPKEPSVNAALFRNESIISILWVFLNTQYDQKINQS